MKPKLEELLKEVRQHENETLSEYVERFNNEAASVRNLEDKQRLFWLKDSLRKGGLFKMDVGVNKPRSLGDFLRRSQKYMDYEEDNMAYRSATTTGIDREEPQESRQKRIPEEHLASPDPSKTVSQSTHC